MRLRRSTNAACEQGLDGGALEMLLDRLVRQYLNR